MKPLAAITNPIMKRIIYLVIVLAALWLVTGCASFEGNGITLGISYDEPNTGAHVELHTAK